MHFTHKVPTWSLCLAACATATLAAIPPPISPTSVKPQPVPAPQSPTPQVKPQGAPLPAPIPPPNLPCVAQNLTADTWNRLQIDKYLADYPGGHSLTLEQYADSKGAQNFRCGIEEFCTSGQICNPVPAPDWYVLLATQEWNNCMNSVFKAVHFAVSTVQGTLALMVTGLAEQNIKAHEIAFGIGSITSLLASAAAIVGIGAAALFLAGFVTALAPIAVAAGVTVVATTLVAPLALQGSSLLENKPADKKSFIKWASVGNMFSQWEIHMQSMITNTTQQVINSPISSNQGISSVLRNGAFLFESQTKSTSELQIDYETVLQARSLNLVLRAMGAFVTRGSDKCNAKGPNGAWGEEGNLSFCGPDKIMMNIVLTHGDKTKNKIQNAKYIATKFGFTTEYIVTQSWNCQQKYQQFEYDPYRDAPLPSDANADCVMNLPVCDLTDQRIDQARHGKHHHTTKACRTQGGLPI
ncbi:hypothetical protein MJO28_013187 [Puccinia striiformis f. sp. tritici]|uniref:DUF7872 domain-containing protein n=2 Tax=Puccinia striiformis f. sp. tritici TaxID=168172 RepID=A0A0L0VDF2_9BASI|nr:hypothetical protein Pst134EA_024343 [Puccinia striiformis f. sp. tritici]KAI9606816.1 hypothetical protein H4Q26_006354 [Puccinia striiformis f. sp. tritici PST-130]KNE97320.1 hypothetical protein PSTG_09431 [Puccinia striiformis f. sp. tritici PST-78]KAH9444773.1 hypothetical protein Pst134EB_025032 [Puccinia striiformis f. sp. tritici]KAH9453471.1 hypothetical protein Pst134EA_024343 [Puccinia striiformis f. sp. tritici]KAI7940902.1 hypothetical protein MJO28_013187 [Puccinia striiformis